MKSNAAGCCLCFRASTRASRSLRPMHHVSGKWFTCPQHTHTRSQGPAAAARVRNAEGRQDWWEVGGVGGMHLLEGDELAELGGLQVLAPEGIPVGPIGTSKSGVVERVAHACVLAGPRNLEVHVERFLQARANGCRAAA